MTASASATDNCIVESAIVKFNDLALYPADVEQLIQEYTDSLLVPEMLYKTSGFSGLLDYIYKKRLREIIESSRGTEGKTHNSLNYTVLDNIFYNLYVPLCYRYGLCPTVLQFSVLVNSSPGQFTDIKSGFYRTDGAKVNPEWTRKVKKWYQVCESATIGKALNESSIGAIFVAKAIYNYNDSQTIRLETGTQETHETPEQIAARHATAELPVKPDLE